jgi:hypothetical protein
MAPYLGDNRSVTADLNHVQLAVVEQTYNLWARGEFQAVDNISRGRGLSSEEALWLIPGARVEDIRDISLAALRTLQVHHDGSATHVDVPVVTSGGEEVAVVRIGVAEDFPGLYSTWIAGVHISR